MTVSNVIDYLSTYGVRYNREQYYKAKPGAFGGLFTGTGNLIKEGFSAAGDYVNYIEVECTGLTPENFKEKLRQFKEQILQKIKKHNGITNISMDCLLKNDVDRISSPTNITIVSVAKYNSIKGNYDYGESKTIAFTKNQQISKSGAGKDLLNEAVSFDNILNVNFTWDKLAKFLDGDDSIRMVISKKGLDDIKKDAINICHDIVSNGGRRRSSRKYKKSNRNVKSSKKRSYTTKYSRTRRYRK
jgi:hypothetical protein